MENLWV